MYPNNFSENVKRVGFLVGMSGVVVSYLYLTEDFLWPGYFALIPCLSAALIISLNYHVRIYDSVVLASLGRWSYSIYLWHWPLIVAGSYIMMPDYWKYIVLFLAIPLGWLSYRYVENACNGWKKLDATFLRVAFVAISILACFYCSYRFSGLDKQLAQFERNDFDYGGEDVDWENVNLFESPDIMLFGDSHARQVFSSFSKEFGSVEMLAHSACLSLPGLVNIYGSTVKSVGKQS